MIFDQAKLEPLRNGNAVLRQKVGTAKLDYSAGLFEVFKYFGGFTDPARAHTDPAVAGTPVDFSHFGPLRYARMSGPGDPNADAAAYNGSNQTGYNPIIDASLTESCAKNYLVFIGNGFPSTDAPCSLLQGVNGISNCTTPPQLPMPQFTNVISNVTTTLGTDSACRTAAACVTAAATTFRTWSTVPWKGWPG